jgi:type I restriction enzyme S subunit
MIAQAHGGVGLRHITKGKLEALELPIHRDLREQRRIATCIRDINETLDEIAARQREVVDEAKHLDTVLFGELEQATKYPRQKIDGLIIDSQNGRSIIKADGGNGKVLTLTAVRDVYLNGSCCKQVQLDDKTADKFSISAGDIFVSRSNTRDLVGLSAVALSDAPTETIYPDLLIKLTVDRSKIVPEYLAFALRFPSVRDDIRSQAKGTSQSMVKISGASLRQIEVPVPRSLKEQEEVLAGLRCRHSKARDVQKSIGSVSVERIRQAILRKAFAGEL